MALTAADISVKLVAGVGYGEARLSVADNGRAHRRYADAVVALSKAFALAGWRIAGGDYRLTCKSPDGEPSIQPACRRGVAADERD